MIQEMMANLKLMGEILSNVSKTRSEISMTFARHARAQLICRRTNQNRAPREKAGGRYATGLLLQLPAQVRFRRDSMTEILGELG